MNLSQRNSLNPFQKVVTEGISLITAVKNRIDTLQQVLPTWVIHDQIDEIIIVDWSSDESIIPIINKYQNGKIFLAIVQDQDKWIQTHAFNLAARMTTKNKTFKIDADVQILPEFFNQHPLTPNIFYTGNWEIARDENETHLNGQVYLYRNVFFMVNGYNEFLKSYGYDDSDLYIRLESAGKYKRNFNNDTLRHIEHENRAPKHKGSSYFGMIDDIERSSLSILRNRHITSTLKKWSKNFRMQNFTIEPIDNHIILCKNNSKNTYNIPKELLLESEIASIKDRLKQYKVQFSDDFLDQLNRNEIIELYLSFLNKKHKLY